MTRYLVSVRVAVTVTVRVSDMGRYLVVFLQDFALSQCQMREHQVGSAASRQYIADGVSDVTTNPFTIVYWRINAVGRAQLSVIRWMHVRSQT